MPNVLALADRIQDSTSLWLVGHTCRMSGSCWLTLRAGSIMGSGTTFLDVRGHSPTPMLVQRWLDGRTHVTWGAIKALMEVREIQERPGQPAINQDQRRPRAREGPALQPTMMTRTSRTPVTIPTPPPIGKDRLMSFNDDDC